jgi:hypothetical protein
MYDSKACVNGRNTGRATNRRGLKDGVQGLSGGDAGYFVLLETWAFTCGARHDNETCPDLLASVLYESLEYILLFVLFGRYHHSNFTFTFD